MDLRKLLTFALLVWLVPCVAHGEAEGDKVERSRQHFIEGSRHYVQQRYGPALDEFQAALRLERRASTLLNIAQCYRQLDRPKQSVAYYRAYLKAWRKSNPGKPPEQAPFYIEVKGHIATLSREAAAKKKAEAPGAPDESTAAAAHPATIPPAAAASEEDHTPVYKKWWFWTIVGAVVGGAAAAGTAAALQPEPADPVMGTFSPGQVRLPLWR